MIMRNLFLQKPGPNLKIRTGVVLLALSAMLLPACANDPNPGGPSAESNVTAEDVADETNELIGQPVTIRSDVVQKISPSTFTVSDEQFFGGETILVVNASGAPFVFPLDENEVQVTGTVAKFVTADINRVYGLGLDPNLYVDYEGKPAIIAQSLAVAVEPDEIAEDPSLYYGRVVSVPGEVGQIVDANTFRFEEDELPVINVNPRTTTTEGEKVVATGVVRPFVVADIERDFDLDLDPELQVEYENKPVVVAQSVFPAGTEPGQTPASPATPTQEQQ